MREFVKFFNYDGEVEESLHEVVDGKLKEIMTGDYYHEKIDFAVNGFLDGIKYAQIEYVLKKIEVEIDEKTKFSIHDFTEKELQEIYDKEGKNEKS